jgi:hypothetical protein
MTLSSVDDNIDDQINKLPSHSSMDKSKSMSHHRARSVTSSSSMGNEEEISPSSQGSSSSSNESSKRRKRVKEEIDLEEGVDYYERLPSDPAVFKTIRQLIKRGIMKEVTNWKTGVKSVRECNYLCLACYRDAKTINAFMVNGDFQETKNNGRISNFVSHLKVVHNITFEDSKETCRKIKDPNEIEFQNSIVNFLISRYQPLSVAECEEFQNMFETGGCKYMVPGRRTIEVLIESRWKELKDLLKLEIGLLQKIPSCHDDAKVPLIQVFSDSVKLGKENYLGYGISFISLDREFIEAALFIEPAVSKSSKSAEMILSTLERELGITRNMISMTLSDTTNSALKIGSEILQGESSNMCCFHLIGLVLGHCIGTKSHEEHGHKIFYELGKNILDSTVNLATHFLNNMDELSGYMKTFGINPRSRPQLATEVRPSSNLAMIRHVLKMYPVYQAYCVSIRNRKPQIVGLFDNVNWPLLVQFEAIIAPLTDWIVLTQGKFRPLLSWSTLIREILLKGYAQSASLSVIDIDEYVDSRTNLNHTERKFPRKLVKVENLRDDSKEIVTKIISLMDEYLTVEHMGKDNTLPALFLDPVAYRLMKKLNPTLYKEARDMVKIIASELAPKFVAINLGSSYSSEYSSSNSSSNSTSNSSSSSSSSNDEIIIIDIGDDETGAVTVENLEQSVENEIDLYLKMPLPDHWNTKMVLSTETAVALCESTNPLDFWKLNSHKLRLLSRVARYFLCGSASTGTQERFFSALGSVRTELRTMLKLNKLESLTSLQINQTLFQRLKAKRAQSVQHGDIPDISMDLRVDDDEDDDGDITL